MAFILQGSDVVMNTPGKIHLAGEKERLLITSYAKALDNRPKKSIF